MIELMPYPPDGEFVMVGVLAVTEEGRLLRKLLEAADESRLWQFFPEIDPAIFHASMAQVTGILDDIETHTKDDGEALYRALTVPREGMIRIRPRGAGVTEDLDAWLAEAYARYIQRRHTERVSA